MSPSRVRWILVLAGAVASGQENAPIGLLRGELQSWSGTARNGQFVFLTADQHSYSCSFDNKTYVERDTERVSVTGLSQGDRLEVVTDHRTPSDACYALTVHVLRAPTVYSVPGVRPRTRPAALSRDPFPSRGELTISGVVVRVTPDLLILRSRTGERKTLRLRADTRFLSEGQIANSGSLRANTVVFVRAHKNVDDEVEANQVIWGEILQP